MSDSVLAPSSLAPLVPPAASLPRVSVVIPVRNDARRLAVCLASLARQNYPAGRLEIIVVDNGSTDGSAEVARQMGAVVLSYPRLRVGALRNRGVAMASGEILAFVDADHELPADWVCRGVDALLRHPARAVGAACCAPRDGTWVQRYWELHRRRSSSPQRTRWLGAGNLFVRRADFLAVGGFREDLVAAEDVDLCLRLGGAQGQVVSDPQIVNIHHGEPPTLAAFLKKEYWRGSSGLKAFIAQGCPWAELPSLLYPLYILIGLLGGLGALAAAVAGAGTGWLWTALAILLLPASLLGIRRSWQLRRADACLPLAVLYLAYGLARAAALFKP